MEQIISIAVYLPVLAVSIGGAALFLFARQNNTTRVVLSLAVEVFFYYLLDAQLVNPYADSYWTALSMALLPSLSPFAIAFLICWIWKLYFEKENLPWHQLIWFAPPIAICSVCIMLYNVVGGDEAANLISLYDKLRQYPDQYMHRRDMRLLFLTEYYAFNVAFTIYSIWVCGFALYAMKRTGFSIKAFYAFMFKKASLPPSHILMLAIITLLASIGLRIIVGRFFLFDHPWWNVICSSIQAFCVAQIALAGFCTDYVECTLRQFFFIDPKEDLDLGIFSNEDEEDEGTQSYRDDDDNEILDLDAFQLVQERLESGLRILMDQEKAYLNSDLHLSDVARRLGTNRNYLSRHINEKYHINFNEYLNRKRIEYSKDYMLNNPNQLLDTIAMECGFSTAQSFGRKFKSMEGLTPRSWLVELLKQQKRG